MPTNFDNCYLFFLFCMTVICEVKIHRNKFINHSRRWLLMGKFHHQRKNQRGIISYFIISATRVKKQNPRARENKN